MQPLLQLDVHLLGVRDGFPRDGWEQLYVEALNHRIDEPVICKSHVLIICEQHLVRKIGWTFKDRVSSYNTSQLSSNFSVKINRIRFNKSK